jgi:hypothetical protein
MLEDEAELEEIAATVRAIRPLLAGRAPGAQGAILADLLSLSLAGHAPAIREDVFNMHMALVRALIPHGERQIFPNGRHPSQGH